MNEIKDLSKVDIQILKWVIKASSKDSVRQNLTGFCLRNGKLIASDGYRAHIAYKTLPMSDGNYRVVSIGKNNLIYEEIEKEFPDIESVVSNAENYIPNWNSTNDPITIGLNPKLLADLKGIEKCAFTFYGSTQPCVASGKIDQYKMKAIVMPMWL